MKAAVFDYAVPASVQEATRLLAEGDGAAKLMAGTQSMGPMLNLRLTRPRVVVDITRVAGLDTVRVDGEAIEIGANVTHAAIEDGLHAPLREHPMREVAAGIAYRAVRTRGTLGGSLAHADPAADWIVTLTALDARLSLLSPRGTRSIAMTEFMHAAYTTALAVDEAIVAVRVPRVSSASRWGYYKFCRKPGEFAEASAAVWAPEGASARVVLGATDGAPVVLPALGQRLGRAELAAAVNAALPDRDPIDNRLHAVCLGRALAQAGYAVEARA